MTNGDAEVRGEVAGALARAAVFRELARALDYPSSQVRGEVAARWRTLLGSTAPWPDGVRAALTLALARLDGAESSLESEHVRLFGPAGPVALTETSWGDAGRLLGKAAALADVGGFYRAFGLRPGTAHPRPEDHLALELEFMSVLALKEAWARSENEAEALAVTREATAKFLAEHLGTWIDAWLAALGEHEAPSFYTALGEAIRTLVRAECARLAVAPRPVGGRLVDREIGGDDLICPRAPA